MVAAGRGASAHTVQKAVKTSFCRGRKKGSVTVERSRLPSVRHCPGADPAVGGNQQTNAEGNITYTQNLGYSGEDARATT